MGAKTFELGDVVYMKSGGYPMTVKLIIKPQDNVVCQWHSAEGHAVFESFSAIMLTKEVPKWM